MKKTKQGVRDLNGIKGKPRGRFLAEVPDNQREAGCQHKSKEIDHWFGIVTCRECGADLVYDGELR